MLKMTGERVILEKLKPMNPMLLEHIARYQFSLLYAKGRVLDFACGTGYGTHMVAKNNKKLLEQIIGIDIDEKTIQYAKKTYFHPLSTYMVSDAVDPNLPEKLGTFDTILSFETIEHVHDENLFMENVYQLLKPSGTVVLSTPFGKGRGKPCAWPYHFHELTEDEFKALFDRFSEVDLYYQNGVLIEPPRAGNNYPIGIAVCKK